MGSPSNGAIGGGGRLIQKEGGEEGGKKRKKESQIQNSREFFVPFA
jgi:hypothetical protein